MLLTDLLLVIACIYFFLFVCEVIRLHSELDPHGVDDPLECFLCFFREHASVVAPKLSMVFRRLLRVGLFPFQWCCADVSIPKGAMSFSQSGFTLTFTNFGMWG